MVSLVEEIRRTTYDIEVLWTKDADFLFLKPSIDEWSVVECVVHLALVEGNILNNVLLRSEKGTGPVQLWKVSKLNHLLVSKRSVKLESPLLFLPGDGFHEFSESFGLLRDIREEVVGLLTRDAALFDGSVFKHPRLGDMTRLDWVWFLVAHSDRHVCQMHDILDRLSKA